MAVAVVAALVAFGPSGDQPTATGAAPAFETVDPQGHPVRLADYRGKAVLINFWASWCVPCRKEFPLLQAVDGHGVAVLGVVFHDTRSAAAAFMRDQGATWPGLQDPGGHIADRYNVGLRPGVPVTVLGNRRAAWSSATWASCARRTSTTWWRSPAGQASRGPATPRA